MMFHGVTLVVFVTALTSALAQEYFSDRKVHRKPKDVVDSKNLYDGQGRKTRAQSRHLSHLGS